MADPDMMKKLKANLVKQKKCIAAMEHADDATWEALADHLDALGDEQARIMGLPEDEITRINQEADAAVEEQINQEIEQTLQAQQRRPRRS
jgi:hypothetical protein